MRLIIGGICQGKLGYAIKSYGSDKTIYRDLYRDLKNGLDASLIEEKAMGYDIVIAEENYSGLLPMDQELSDLLESYGRLLIRLAQRAESVERVVCGIGERLR